MLNSTVDCPALIVNSLVPTPLKLASNGSLTVTVTSTGLTILPVRVTFPLNVPAGTISGKAEGEIVKVMLVPKLKRLKTGSRRDKSSLPGSENSTLA